MPRLPLRTTHRWIAVVSAVFLLAWLVSGIAIVANRLIPYRGPVVRTADERAPFASIAVSIPEAIEILNAERDRRLSPTSVDVVRHGAGIVYRIASEGEVHHVDALSGTILFIERERAESLAHAAAPDAGDIETVTMMTSHTFFYPWGPLPAYRVEFERKGIVVFVSTSTGQITYSSRASRLYRTVASLHDLEPLRRLYRHERLHELVLVATMGLSLAAVLTGIGIALWPRAPAGR